MDPIGQGDLSVHLARLLAGYPALERPSAPPEPLGNAGGLSGARLWRYASGRGLLVARAWPPEGPNVAALERIHRWLRAANGPEPGLGFLPVPLPALDGRTVHELGGRLWEVAPWLAGESERGWEPEDLAHPHPQPDRVRAGFAALGAFHQALNVDRTRGPSPGILNRLSELDGWLAGGLPGLKFLLDRRWLPGSIANEAETGTGTENDPCRELARRWVERASELGPRLIEPLRRASGLSVALQPCLRDARPDHFLFEGSRLTGLVDFGAMGIETVAADLARLLTEWTGNDRTLRALALRAYDEVRPLEPVETALIDVFEDAAALLGAGRWIGWHFIEGRTFSDPRAVLRGIERGLKRLSMREAMGPIRKKKG